MPYYALPRLRGRRHGLWWGFDHVFANYSFKIYMLSFNTGIEFPPSGNMLLLCNNKGVSEIMAAEMIVKSPYGLCCIPAGSDTLLGFVDA